MKSNPSDQAALPDAPVTPAAIGALQQDASFALSYRLREPPPSTPKACVVLLHGVGSNETDLADLALAIDPDVLVVLARGRIQFAPGQFGWFGVNFTANGPLIVAEEAEASRHALIRFLDQLQSTYGISPGRTLIAGFSQGGILSASVGLSAPEQVAGFAILSGRILPELQPHVASAERLTNLSAFVAHGELDNKLPVSWAQRSHQWLNELGVAHRTRLYPVGHGLSADMRRDFLGWVEERLAAKGG